MDYNCWWCNCETVLFGLDKTGREISILKNERE